MSKEWVWVCGCVLALSYHCAVNVIPELSQHRNKFKHIRARGGPNWSLWTSAKGATKKTKRYAVRGRGTGAEKGTGVQPQRQEQWKQWKIHTPQWHNGTNKRKRLNLDSALVL